MVRNNSFAFYGGRAVRRFRNTGIVQNSKSTRVVRNSGGRRIVRRIRPRLRINRANTELVGTFTVYCGVLKKDGLRINLGPDPQQFNNETYVQTALTYNNYLPLRATVKFTPLRNQTNAIGVVNAYLTTDIAAELPDDDTDMKRNTTSHQGTEWFAGRQREFRLRIPRLKQNTYETGSGDTKGNTPYEPCGYIMVKPTSAGEGDIAFGEVYMDVTVKFSSPATSLTGGQKYVINDGVNKDTPITSKGNDDLFTSLFMGDFSKYLCPDFDRSKENDFYQTIKDVEALAALPAYGKFAYWTDKIDDTLLGKLYSWDATAKNWVEKPPTYVRPVYLINNVVPAYEQPINYPEINSSTLHSSSIPIHNKVTEESDVYSVLVTEQPVKVTIEDQPIKVDIQDQPISVEVANVVDTKVVNDVNTKILDQPIDVHQTKDFGETIADMLKSLIVFLREDQQEEFCEKLMSIDIN